VAVSYPTATQPLASRSSIQLGASQPTNPPITYPHYQPPAPQYTQQSQQQQHGYYGIQTSVVAPQVEMMPRNWFTTPTVLSQHEPREDRPWASLGVELFRGAMMITGLIGADFFSNVPLLKKPNEPR
jgi:hypothetical protein